MKTFVIRLFVPAGPEIPSDGLHGVVEEVAGGRRTTFHGGEQLLALLGQPAAAAGDGRAQTVPLMLGSEER